MLLARLWRTRSIWRLPYEDSDRKTLRLPYEDSDRKTLMKTSFQRFFLSESSHG